MPFSNSAVAGAGTLQRPWAMLMKPCPVGTGEASIRSMPSKSKPIADPHNVGNGIDRPHFMKMHFPNFDAVNFGFGFAEPRKNSLGQIFRPGRQLARIDHFDNVMQMPVLMFRLV